MTKGLLETTYTGNTMKKKMEVIEGKFKKGVWGHDREVYTDEDIEFFNEFLRTIAKHRPQAAEVIWNVPTKDKRPKLHLLK